MERYLLPIVMEKDEDGYFVSCPSLQGCYSQGETYEMALENIRDAIRLHIHDRRERGEEISVAEMVSVMALEVAD